jgi:hypothetical protein
LQARVVAARGALDAQLARRALAATRVADSQRDIVPDAADTVRTAATAALTGAPDQREALENDLTRAILRLRLVPGDPGVTELATETRRVTVARQLHNDAVRDTLDLRHRRLPRALRLGAQHPRPRYFDIAEFTLAERPNATVTVHRPSADPAPGPR